jgi:hypothetical protein
MSSLFPMRPGGNAPGFVPVTWVGASLTRYATEMYAIGTQFKPIPGVYVFCKYVAADRVTAIYVGETDNLQRRLNTDLSCHHCWPQARQLGATHVCVLPAPQALVLRERIETDLRHALRPPLNKQ